MVEQPPLWSISRGFVGRATVFALVIVLSGGLTASARQTTQQTPTQPTVNGDAPAAAQALVDPVTGKPMSPTAAPARTAYPDGVKPGAGPAPGVAPGGPSPVRSSGPVGPAGQVSSERSSPDGPAKVTNVTATAERLGPGGAADKAPTNERLGPTGPAGQAPTSQRLGPDGSPQPARKASQPAKPSAQPQAQKPSVSSDRGRVTNDRGIQVFIDPATGQVTEPTDAQLQELAQQNQASVSVGQSEGVERASLMEGGGMMADLPESLLPVVMATIGSDGKVKLEERQAPAGAKDQSAVVETLGPGGQHVELPPPAEVTITIVNGDGAGEGFNDPTAVAPVFGNPGTTRGAQRLNAFRAAAEYWGAILKSPVPILVNATMDPKTCSATSAILGSAGPATLHRLFAGSPVSGIWYVQATANSRFGADLDANTSDINASFNSDVDDPGCLGATSWWYGIGAPAPAETLDFYTVVLHEIGHGIGFLALTNLGTGEKFYGFDDAYGQWLWDLSGLGWPSMTNGQRVTSSTNTGQVIFVGPRAAEASRGLQSAGLNGSFPRVYAPNPVQSGSSISHFDTVMTPNDLMEPALTAPPGPYAFLTSGALEDIGWRLNANGVFDYGGIGTWTWNPTNGWNQPTTANPSDLEPFNGNFIGQYPSGTWLWNSTTSSWLQLTAATPTMLKACGNNLLWAGPGNGLWRWHATLGWAQLTAALPETINCFGNDAVWEGGAGTWLYNFSTGWLQIAGANPIDVQPCGSRLAWWWAGETWYWEAASGWHLITSVNPQSADCYRGQLAWAGTPGTWIYNFSTGWRQIAGSNPEQILAWGPNLVWENAAFGTWIWDDSGWSRITSANPTNMEVLGAVLLWSYPAGTWVWSGGGLGTGWTYTTGAAPTEIVSTGQVK